MVRTPLGEREIEPSDILSATSRVPNPDGIGLDEVGVSRPHLYRPRWISLYGTARALKRFHWIENELQCRLPTLIV